jgi:metal-responsive CopG/Arc/MetJ family transcriptional regulator
VTGKGRPRIGTAVLIRIPDQLLANLDTDAQRQEVSRAELIRDILTDHYQRNQS